ncbi:hypothetical protein [Streptomyces sp. URMC 124]|uniref:hypothetical protein n=1 Tax=Streptomyces sp. URMC 124 TaxID=3423405 RepID=UPI003F1A5C4A
MSDIATSLKDQYTAQVTADIERVSQEREHVRTEISALQQRLETLEADHRQLLQLRATLTGEPAAAAQRPAPEGAAAQPKSSASKAGEPRADERKTGESKAGQSKAGESKTGDSKTGDSKTGDSKTGDSKAGERKTGEKAGAGAKVPRPRSSQPAARARVERRGAKAGRGEVTWGELLLSYLAGEQEPKSVAEITHGVSTAHPARTVQAAVVRNTLEALVAQDKVQRRKQARSVTYSVVGQQQEAAAEPSEKA